ncbi:hypothetical protein MKW94_021162 [Papaver nudicaule]|uniref:Membrane-associated kinase regulator 6 n=1 Tax=Papaver nudicaule TaxID=74823 RepID=A0AA41RQK8_PAPNU|nr:hypothetical protein [Papaver nudicaule]
MEGNTATATISIESFSYRWLVNLKSTLESLDDHSASSDIEAAAFIVMDPKNTPSKRFLAENNLDFNFPTTPSSNPYNTSNFSLVHAEELFSNGTFLVPTSTTTLFSTKKIIEKNSIDNNGVESISSPMNTKPLKNTIVISIHQIHSIFAKKCWKSSKKIFRKCLIGLFHTNSKTTIYESTSSSPSSSPKSSKSLVTSRSLLVDRRRRNSQKLNRSMSSPSSLTTTTTIAPEGSIYEAVLHCKKSIEK